MIGGFWGEVWEDLDTYFFDVVMDMNDILAFLFYFFRFVGS